MLLALASFALLSGPSQVYVVDSLGTGDFLDLPAAVQAAASGDVILVRSGEYSGFEVDGKALSIQAHPQALDAPRILGLVDLRDVPLGETFLLDGFEVVADPVTTDLDGESHVTISFSDGSVRLQDLAVGSPNLEPTMFGYYAVSVINSDDVAVTDSTLVAGDVLTQLGYAGGSSGYDGSSGLFVSNSDVAVYRSVLVGGDGGSLPNGGIGGVSGAGATIYGGSLFLGQCFLQGGTSGDTGDGILYGYCVNGGPGLEVGTFQTEAASLGTTTLGGSPGSFSFAACTGGGETGPGVSGTLRNLQGMPRGLIAEGAVYSGASVDTIYRGQPGDLAVRLVGLESKWAWRPFRKGTLLVDVQFPQLFQIQGTLDGSGTLTVNESFTLPAGTPAWTLFQQGLFVSADGQATLSNPRAVTILESGL